ncbi:uncharacterized protein BROUX77_007832 [Berkeleyomyces rouxiae]|uniref:uncharacterized protein n=1 Tax=Berkeleyomyces rouxiae TaxID=2035830 RepID=UPI003B7F097D
MTSLFSRYRSSNANGGASGKDAGNKKDKDEPAIEITPLEKMLQTIGPVDENDADKFFGLENFGNTCYCNSIVQSLFYSEAFRDRVVNYPGPLSESTTKVEVAIRPPAVVPPPAVLAKQKTNGNLAPPNGGPRPEDRPDAPEYKKRQAMLKGPILELTKENATAHDMDECTFTSLKDIFLALLQSKTRTGVLSPQRFLEIFKRDNEMFRNSMHQDAHEFYGIVLNDIITNLQDHDHKIADDPTTPSAPSALATSKTFDYGLVQDIFEGQLISETKCLSCEAVSQKDETFLDLSIDLDEYSSVTSCLSKFSEEEVLCERNKFHCDGCGGLQEAEKRMRVQRLPKVMALHLKRFKYTEDFTRLEKLHRRVVYPPHFRLLSSSAKREVDKVYELYAVVVHIGGNAYHGHYVSVIKTKEWGWLLFDDEMVEPVDEEYVNTFFGEEDEPACAYVLFYQETVSVTYRDDEESGECSSLANHTNDDERTPISSSVFTTENGFANMTPSTGRSSLNPLTEDPPLGLAHARTAPILSEALSPLEDGYVYTAPPIAVAAAPAATEDRKAEKKRLKMEKKMREHEFAATQAAEAERRKAEVAQQKLEYEKQKQAREDIKKAGDASKGKAEPEPKLRKVSTGGNLLDRASWSSRSMSRKSLNFLSSKKRDQDKDKQKVPDMPATPTILEPSAMVLPPAVNGTTSFSNSTVTESTTSLPPPPPVAAVADPASPAEKIDFRSRFSFGIGKKKSTPALS